MTDLEYQDNINARKTVWIDQARPMPNVQQDSSTISDIPVDLVHKASGLSGVTLSDFSLLFVKRFLFVYRQSFLVYKLGLLYVNSFSQAFGS